MKNILIILAWLAVGIHPSFGGEEKIKGNGNVVKNERSLTPFSKIATAGSIDLVIAQDGTEKVVVETDENIQDAVITEVEDGSLNIHIKDHVRINSTRLVVFVHCKKLEAISSGGSGDIKTETALRSDELKLSHGGSGNFVLDLDVKKMKLSTAGSGDFDLKGSVGDLVISMAGSGDIDARSLDCEQAKISSAGSGDVHLKKGTAAKVSSVGSGDVSYH